VNQFGELRRQYLLSPRTIPGLPGWIRLTLANGLFLTAHPDLPVHQAVHGSRSIVLLGYIIKSDEPSWSNDDIIRDIVERIATPDDAFDLVVYCGGRFAIIVTVGDDSFIFHDAGGLRQIFCHIDLNDGCWIASEPNLIARQLGLKVDNSVQEDLDNSDLFAGNPDYWYPGSLTLYPSIRRLLPNHYFDIRSKQAIRYWPRKPISRVPFTEAVDKISRLLVGLMRGASKRSPLALGISCGLDSRLLLAASRELASDIQFFTQMGPLMREDDPDILIPKRLSERLGFQHKVLVLPERLPPDLSALLKDEMMAGKEFKGINAYSIAEDLLQDRSDTIVVYGNLSEITKRDRFRYPQVPSWLINGAFLTECLRMTGSATANREVSDWLNSVRPLTRKNLDLLDLTHWEHRVGSWAATTFRVYDIAFETFCPYNCRRYIEIMWGVPFRQRTMPDYRLHHALVRQLWPETLVLPVVTINRERNRFRRWAIDVLYRTWLFDAVRYPYLLFYRRPKSYVNRWRRKNHDKS
jgi:hypothetical protein